MPQTGSNNALKPSYLVLAVPVLLFFILAGTLDVSPLLRFYTDYDLTPYLAARSLSDDHDLAYTQLDSDRYFKEQLQRPSRFLVARKKIISSSGDYREYYVFHAPDFYTFALVPFVKLFSLHGIFVLNALLLGAIYFLGYFYYKDALNSIVYYTLVPLPILFFIPSHHLFLFAAISASVFFALRRHIALCAVALAIAVSSQICCALLVVLFLTYWTSVEEDAGRAVARFGAIFIICLLLVWGVEHQMYPGNLVSETRWINEIPDEPLAESWKTLPIVGSQHFTYPQLPTVIDLVFGRTVGSFVYGFAAFAMILAGVWSWREPLVKWNLLFVVLLLIFTSFTNPLSWNSRVFANDFSMLIWSLPFFLFPLLGRRSLFVSIAIPSIVMVGPLIVNPLGAITDRYYYLQAFPYRYFPVELSLVGKIGRTAKPDFRLQFPGGWVFFLDDNFYHDQDFFWVRGESNLEFLLRIDPAASPVIRLQNGDVDDHVIINIGDRKEEFWLAPEESAYLDLKKFQGAERVFGGYRYLHGRIDSKNGYAPKMLSRENPDYRYLGCQIHLNTNRPTQQE